METLGFLPSASPSSAAAPSSPRGEGVFGTASFHMGMPCLRAGKGIKKYRGGAHV